MQHAYGLIIGSYDFAYLYSGTVYLAHNSGTTNYDLTCVNGAWVGTSVVSVVGDSSAGASATVIADPAGAYGLQVKDACIISLSYLEYADPNNNGAKDVLTEFGLTVEQVMGEYQLFNGVYENFKK